MQVTLKTTYISLMYSYTNICGIFIESLFFTFLLKFLLKIIIILQREPVKKKVKAESSSRTDDKEASWQLSKNRFARVTDFKGKIYVDIRETYLDSDGNQRPGKKGIMLTVDQWQKLKASVEEIDQEVKKISC